MTSASRIETHPYGPFIPKGIHTLILGTFPAREFSSIPKRLDSTMIDFNYGRIAGKSKNLLWRLLGDVYGVSLQTPDEIKTLLTEKKIGLADVYSKIIRKSDSSADSAIQKEELNPELRTILQVKTLQIVFCTSKNVEKIFHREFKPTELRPDLKIETLLSPSQAANLSIASRKDFKENYAHLEGDRLYQYRLDWYRKHFR